MSNLLPALMRPVAWIPEAHRRQLAVVLLVIAALLFPLLHDNDADIDSMANAAAYATLALGLSPADTDLMIMRASAEGMLARYPDAVDDLNEALGLDASRTDALVARAVMHRMLNRLDLAQVDVSRALVLDPDDADALLERGILRQRMGDADGARADWEHARGIDPNSTTADLAEQNLSLLEVGPRQP